MELFTPVKVLSQKYAESLLNGVVFMRPLREFGSWTRFDHLNDKELDNSFRGDYFEGTVEVFSDVEDSVFFQKLNPNFKEIVKNVRYIDQGEIQYLKLFCLYRMEYDPTTDFFKQPDPRIRNFGDTAVIILDFGEFLRRFALKLFERWPKAVFLVDRITYYDHSLTKKIPPAFGKSKQYEYQKELRIAIGELHEGHFAQEPEAEKVYALVRSAENEILQIGNIRDIAIRIPIDDFLNLKLPSDFWCRWPTSNDPSKKTLFDLLVQDTERQLKHYETKCVKPAFSTW